ncbi:MAG: ABC transporter permease [Schleiferiaceae bacterium]|jgi:putative ABC transport system permease protein|nr:ABC transporter permease [Schleiferiaceae bacterium]
MFQNFLKITFRNLFRNKIYSGISIFGLAVSISCCLLIALFVFDEMGYDSHHEKKDRIVRLTSVLNFNGEINAALTNLPSGPTLLEEYPEVENYVRFQGAGAEMEFSANDRLFKENWVWFTDSTLFDVFSYDVLEGNPGEALRTPMSMVLVKSLADKLFPDGNALGERVKGNNTYYTVTAIIADPPPNSEIRVNAFLSINTLPPGYHASRNQDWFRIGLYTYLLFKDKPNIPEFEAKLVDFEKKYVQPWSEQNEIVASLEYHILPLSDVHFDEGREYDLPKGNITYIYIFSLLALFILLIASINYINLALAQSNKRAKEVGVRKTLGAAKSSLVSQFLGESLIIAVIASIIGLIFVQLMMGMFNEITDKEFAFVDAMNGQVVGALLAIIVLIGLLAGSYPALVLSSFKPVRVLKGLLPKEGGIGGLRKTLILVQFVFSLFMIASTLLIDDQMEYLKSVNLGFDKENIVSLRLPNDTAVQRRTIPWIDELRNDNRVKAVSLSSLPNGRSTGELMFRIERDGTMNEQTVNCLFVDEDFIKVLGLDTLYGRNFNPNIQTDVRQAFIVNETAMKVWGWEENPLGKRVQWGIEANGAAQNDGQVVGVVNDFNFLSLHNKLEPIVLCFNPNGSNNLTVKLTSGDYTGMIKELETRWDEIAPAHPFEFSFYDDILQRNYETEMSMHEVFKYFALISIILASLGLFALVSFSIENRIKEIGIRKVLGASTPQILWILTREFAYLLGAAFVVIVPIVIYLMNRWLEEFAYTVDINPLSFVFALIVAFVLSGLTISYHTWRIMKTKPIHALRYE